MGWNLDFSPTHWDSTVPIPDSEACTSTIKVVGGAGCLRMGVVVKASLSLMNAFMAAWVHFRCLGPPTGGL